MVLIEVAGLIVSSTKVVVKSVIKSFSQAVAINAPNGTIFQKIGGALFGVHYTTEMIPQEALSTLGFEITEKPSFVSVQERLKKMITINDLSKGGSPFLNERFIAASHIIAKSK